MSDNTQIKTKVENISIIRVEGDERINGGQNFFQLRIIDNIPAELVGSWGDLCINTRDKSMIAAFIALITAFQKATAAPVILPSIFPSKIHDDLQRIIQRKVEETPPWTVNPSPYKLPPTVTCGSARIGSDGKTMWV